MAKENTIFAVMIAALFIAAVPAAASADAVNYFPPETAVEGYKILWQKSIETEDMFTEDGGNITIAAQVWYKNDTVNGTTAFVGVIVAYLENSPFDKEVSPQAKLILNQLSINFTGNTYWELFVSILNASGDFRDITAEIGTTESSIEYNAIDFYFIVSKDAGYFIISFALTVSNLWFQYNDTMFTLVMDSMIEMYRGFLMAWYSFVKALDALGDIGNPFAGGIPGTPSASLSGEPSGERTDKEAVKEVTAGVGTAYTAESGTTIPGYEGIIPITLTILAIYTLLKRKRLITKV